MLAIEVIGGDVSFPLYNPHGDIWAWTDHQGDITATSSFDEYGVPQQAASGEPGVDRYGWLGRQQREWDPEVGLTLMGVRGYDPALGRFLSVDPIRGGSANDYDYVTGDPCNSYDLDGRWGPSWLQKTLKVVAGAAGVAALGACILATAGVCAAVAWSAVGIAAVSRHASTFNSGSDWRDQGRWASWARGTAVDAALVFAGGRAVRLLYGGIARHASTAVRVQVTTFRITRLSTAWLVGQFRPRYR
jgi:RHS repeat-associated protein